MMVNTAPLMIYATLNLSIDLNKESAIQPLINELSHVNLRKWKNGCET